MEKVKITRELADGIKSIQNKYKSGIEFDIEALGNEYTENCEGIKVVYNFVHESRENMFLYFKALVNGYEVEETPGDKVVELFRTYGVDPESEEYERGYHEGVQFGITETLDLLNIKIEGIN